MITDIISGFAVFLPYVFILCVVGILWNAVIRAFCGGRL